MEQRSRIGDWEIDTVVGKAHQGGLVTLVERQTGPLLMRRVDRVGAAEVTEAIVEMTSGHRPRMLTIASDNGREFAWHEEIASRIGVEITFAHPCHSWERETNENTNGLIRQYSPKSAVSTRPTAS